MKLHGLRLDGKFSDSAQQTWVYAKNVLLSRGFDELENETGEVALNTSIVGDIFGRLTTPNEIILFIHSGTDVFIKSMDTDGTLHSLLTTTDTYLDCSSSTIYVEGVHCYNNEGDLIIVWTTGIHKPMIMNVTHCLNTPVTITAESQLKDYYLFPEFNHNNFSLSSTAIVNGGRLPTAAYFVTLAYELEPGVNTNYGVISNPIFITDDDSLTNYKQFKGNGSLVITNKGFIINVTAIDSIRSYFKLVIIQKTETGTKCFITKRIKNSASTVSVFIDDLDKLIPFNLNEVVVSNPAYNTVKSITQSNKRLRLFNLTKPTKLSLTTIYDNLIPNLSVNWVNDTQVSLTSTKNSYKDSVFIFDKRGFRENEVIALYLGLRLKTGGYYGIYHIPGRAATGAEATAETTVDGTAIKNYKLTSCATKDAGGFYGTMGFWQNENETYGNNYGTILGNNKVRHHRFPSAGQLHTWRSGIMHTTAKANLLQTVTFSTTKYNTEGTLIHYGILTPASLFGLGTFAKASDGGTTYNRYTALYSQTISLSFNINMSGQTGDHHVGNMTITKYNNTPSGWTSSVLYNTGHTSQTPGEVLNFSYSNTDVYLQTGDYIDIEFSLDLFEASAVNISNQTTPYFSIYESTTTHEVLGLRIALDWNSVPANIQTQLSAVVDGWEILYAKKTLNNQIMLDQSIAIQEGVGYRFYGFDSMVNKLNIEPTHVQAELKLDTADYTTSAYINEVINYSKETSAKYSAIKSIKYLPEYNIATIPSNENRENCYYFEPTSGTFNLNLVNLISIKNDVYLDFSNQELVSTGIIKPLANTSAFSLYGGDTYIGHNSVLTFPTGVLSAPKIWYFPVYSSLNIGMRYEGENIYEKFYPATDITKVDSTTSPTTRPYLDAMYEAGVANYYFYNNDYHLLNTFRQDDINNELTSLVTSYPNRGHSSMPQPLESNSVYWRNFKPMDYFDMVNNKGEVYKAIGNENIVYIQTKYSIFRGIIVDKLVTGNIDVALKTIEMFDRPLEELFDADGSYIKPWNREGTILTPYGLVVADLEKGSIFVISDKATEITKLGIENWFRKTVKSTMTFGTKETIGSGVILGYDDINKRLLVTIKNSNPGTIANFTLSFNFETMYWVSFHTNVPDKYIWNANALYGLNGNDVYKLNSGNYGIYSGSYADSIIDFAFNSNTEERILLTNVRWTTTVETSAGINDWTKTINKLLVYSKNMCSNEITITKKAYSYSAGAIVETGTARFRDGEWNCNDIKDYLTTPNSVFLDANFNLITSVLKSVVNYFELSKIISKFITVRISFTNTSANEKFRISNIAIDAKKIL